MVGFSISKTTKSLLNSPYFWINLIITLFLIFMYQFWPWPSWDFISGPWHWLGWLSNLYSLVIFEIRLHFVGVLFLVPIIFATVMLRWPGTLTFSFLALIGILPVIFGLWSTFNSWFSNIFLLLLPAIAIFIIKIELELRQKDREIFIEREKESQAYLAKILEAQEKERKRIAQELHDDSVQSLLAVASYAELIESDHVDDMAEIKKKAKWIKETTRSTVEDIRKLSMDLRPSILDNMGLVPALKYLTQRIYQQHGIKVNLAIESLDEKINSATEVILFRVMQEALYNIERHSKASEALIGMKSNGSSIKITIKDNGKGFVLPNKFADLVKEGKLGIIGMQERIQSLNGSFLINSASNQGTLLSIEIPAK